MGSKSFTPYVKRDFHQAVFYETHNYSTALRVIFCINFYRSRTKICRKYGDFMSPLSEARLLLQRFSRNTSQPNAHLSIEFDQNRPINVVIMGKNLFRPLGKILLSLHPVFTKHTNLQQHYVDIFCTAYHPNRSRNMKHNMYIC